MKKISTFTKYVLAALLAGPALVALSSCKKDFLEEQPLDIITPDQRVFQGEATSVPFPVSRTMSPVLLTW